MSTHRVLILGATGRTGGRVATQLLERGIAVRAIVRSADRLPPGITGNPLLEVVQADLLAMPMEQLVGHLEGCDTVVSCLGHTISARGLFGAPHLLVERSIRRVHEAVEVHRPAAPMRLILMSSVSVNLPDRADTRRGAGERAYLGALRAVLPPARDNQRAADFLSHEVGPTDPHLQWVAVRPDTLEDGDVGGYALHETLVASVFRPDHTRMANVAHFMCELATDDAAWQRWRGRMPVIVDVA
ncbi:MAG: NAD(P)H-binding protein, partial [Actinomycetia bacterium]|nr:NAD(P)H-binding protein [Actinomycetes bacterium]